MLIQYSLKIIRWFFTLSELSIDCYFKTGFSLYAINCLGKLSIIFKSSHWRCFIKKVFLTICQNSQEYTCAKVSFFNKVAGLKPGTLLKKRLWHSCFSVTFKTLLRTPFLQDTSVWLFCIFHIFKFCSEVIRAVVKFMSSNLVRTYLFNKIHASR